MFSGYLHFFDGLINAISRLMRAAKRRGPYQLHRNFAEHRTASD
jgi:hypothetical protein